MSILITMAGIYILLFHHKDDDPAGVLALCMVTTFVSLVVTIAVTVFEKILRHGVDLTLENEQVKSSGSSGVA